MPRKKVSSPTHDAAMQRLAAVKSIDATLDLGSGLSVASYGKLIEETRIELEKYNTLLSEVDAQMAKFHDKEKELADYSERILLGVAVRYGKKSAEYEQAGGTRKDQIKRPRKTEKPT